MIVTVRVKLKGNKPLQGTLELKGPFHTGDVVTLITGFAGKVLSALARDYIEVEVEPSVYEHLRDKEHWEDAY